MRKISVIVLAVIPLIAAGCNKPAADGGARELGRASATAPGGRGRRG